GHGAGLLPPAAGLEREASAAGGGKPVVLGFAVVLAGAPVAGEPAAVFEAMQRRVKRTLLHFEDVFGGALDDLGNRVAVRVTGGERAQDHHVERSLEHVAGE